ncbi:hypothetical protein K4F52_010040 [Lecanicillium sp. MT-2017a]|nr:hypothetical protein K4F52_010040 [Lecanicillium sp. MT-2017a]
MNRFRAKKRTKEVSEPRPSLDNESSGPFRMFGKTKKTQDNDYKKDVDLDAALPASDDFRTSLLMTGLSARFSMLREQDDPFSKLGKASDDSVLQPKRQSRLMEYGFISGLQDIAEIESINAANLHRVDSSQASESNSINGGSIMSRSRPNDGNNLFGGRQKIYRLPASSKGGGGLGGRIVYDDDVAQSAFQKWRQTERGRLSIEEDSFDPEASFEYNKRRETNSTTSSGVSAGRNSTAATSVVSQVANAKDAQSGMPPSTNSVASIDRNFTRTRRLYEQGLTQDLQDQQSSALSRMDTLSKSRRAARTPDVPSPTNATFGDRVMDKKTVLTKGSAPNLRSFTPPSTGPYPFKEGDAAAKFPVEQKPASYGVSPPLSPPISEADDHPMLPIQPNDRGKATAMGMFNRPTHQYDDSKYTQRQRQMQQDRDVPTGRSSSVSRSSANASRSRSSSVHRRDRQTSDNMPTKGDGKKDYHGSSFFDDSDEPSTPNIAPHYATNLGAQLSVERPSDNDHPAFRKSALPTPLSLSSRASDDEISLSGKHKSGNTRLKEEPPEDSPTLPVGAGLSGMVRQHLRSQSTASSIYDNSQPPNGASHEADSPEPNRSAGHVDTNAHSWGLNDDEFSMNSGSGTPTSRPMRADSVTRREQDDFARHLADGARRVREKLTSYAESDSEQSTPPLPPSESAKDLAAARSNALGILRTKSSRTSLFDRKGDRDQGDLKQSKSGKLVKASPSAQSMGKTNESSGSSSQVKEDGNHAGLKAFRQARRELQKMKEMEVQQRHSPQKPGSPPDRPNAQRAFSHDPGMSPPMYNRKGISNRQMALQPERDRSGSDSSNEAREPRRPEVHRGYSGYGESTSSPKGKRRDISEPTYRHSDGLEARQHGTGLPGATASTPNLHAPNVAPPLPPINPRRKSPYGGAGRRSEDARAPHISVNGDGANGHEDVHASEQQRQRLRRATSDHNGDRVRQHPPPAPSYRPPLPHANISNSSVPGGMI